MDSNEKIISSEELNMEYTNSIIGLLYNIESDIDKLSETYISSVTKNEITSAFIEYITNRIYVIESELNHVDRINTVVKNMSPDGYFDTVDLTRNYILGKFNMFSSIIDVIKKTKKSEYPEGVVDLII